MRGMPFLFLSAGPSASSEVAREQQEELTGALLAPPEDGRLWSGPKVSSVDAAHREDVRLPLNRVGLPPARGIQFTRASFAARESG